jgi:hypothetical protein
MITIDSDRLSSAGRSDELDESRCRWGQRAEQMHQDWVRHCRRIRARHHRSELLGDGRHRVGDECGTGTCDHKGKDRLTLRRDHY